MAQYSNLKAYIEEKIYENGTQAITGDILQDVLKVMTDDLGEFYQMGGVASPSTDLGTPDAKVIYFATEAGTYTNFGGITLAAGEVALLIFETSWTKETLNVLSAANGGVKTANLADGAVTTEKIAGGAVGTAKIANSAVTSGKVADGAIGTAKIADGAIDADKIAANAVESAKIKNGAVTEGKINDGAVTAGKVAANAVTTAKIADDAVTTAKLNDGAVTEDKIATDAVTSGKVKDGAIGTAKIAAGAVTHAKIGAGAVEESNIKDGAVTSDKIANGAVGSDQLAEGAFSAENLADGSVTTDKLADEAVTAEKIADGAVTAGKFANGSVTTIKLGSGAVTTEKIGDGMVTRQKLADSSVGTSKIIDGAVTTDKVADGAITDAKLENPVSVSQNTLSIGGEDKGELAGQLEENPEWVDVVTDSEDKILYGVKTDGKFYFGAGCPPQVQEYVQNKINELSLDEYEDIVAFLNGLEEGDKTLQTLLNEKVDKEEGKSLIDTEYASTKSTVNNPEFLEVTTDSEDKVLEGIQINGTKVIGGDIKVLGDMEVSGVSYKVIENPEYLAAWVDAKDKVIFGLKTDGKTYIGDADFLNEIKNNKEAISEINSTIVSIMNSLDIDALSSITAVENPEFIEVKTDAEGKVLAGRTPDGAAFENVGLSTPKVSVDGATIENIEDKEGRTEITTDSEGKVISYRDADGVKHENVGIETDNASINHLNLTENGMTEFQQVLVNSDFFLRKGDYSTYISNDGDSPLHINIPSLARVNLITDYNLSRLSKAGYAASSGEGDAGWPAGIKGVTYDIPIEMEFWDGQGVYFKKKILISAQGASTMWPEKKNIAIDMFDSDWDEGVFSVKFGDWVPQDSFHLKAYHNESLVGVGVWSYKVYQQMLRTLGVEEDYAWKRGLLDTTLNTPTYAYGSTLEESALFDDTGAMCVPDGFPVIVYQNGKFWGLYSWQLKKHRDNYHMSKSNTEHIHLDGRLGMLGWSKETRNDGIDWTKFEIRNPKNLVYKTAKTTYDNVTGEVTGSTYKYDVELYGPNDPEHEYGQDEIAGIKNTDGTTDANYLGDWAAGSYAVDKIVKHLNNYFINTVANNTKEPVLEYTTIKDGKEVVYENTKKSPDYKNKTKCGWINCTNSVKVKNHLIDMNAVMGKIWDKEDIYIASQTSENLAALKSEIETHLNVINLIDYIIVNDVVGNNDALGTNWQWTTWDGIKWFCNLYDCDQSFGYGSDVQNTFLEPRTSHFVGYTHEVFRIILDYYTDELNSRYASLRNSNVISSNNIVGIIREWIKRVGFDFFEKDNNKWGERKHIDNIARINKWIDDNISKKDNLFSYLNS